MKKKTWNRVEWYHDGELFEFIYVKKKTKVQMWNDIGYSMIWNHDKCVNTPAKNVKLCFEIAGMIMIRDNIGWYARIGRKLLLRWQRSHSSSRRTVLAEIVKMSPLPLFNAFVQMGSEWPLNVLLPNLTQMHF